jgi:hypothetical protein
MSYEYSMMLCINTRSERITLTLAHFPLSLFLFHFAESDLPPPPDPSSFRPSPTLDGTDLIGWVFNDPDLGLCTMPCCVLSRWGLPIVWRLARASSTFICCFVLVALCITRVCSGSEYRLTIL